MSFIQEVRSTQAHGDWSTQTNPTPSLSHLDEGGLVRLGLASNWALLGAQQLNQTLPYMLLQLALMCEKCHWMFHRLIQDHM